MAKFNRNKKGPKIQRLSMFSVAFIVFLSVFSGLAIWYVYGKNREERSQEFLLEGKDLAAKGFNKAAKEKFMIALELNPYLTDAMVKLGNIAAASENFAISLPYYKKALSQDSTNFEATIGLAVSLDGIGDFVAAEIAYKKAIFEKSNFSEIYYNLGFLYQRQRLYEEAVKQYEKALQLKPKFLQAQANLGLCWDRLHDPGKAIMVYRRAIALHLKEGPLYTRLGSSLMKIAKYDAAELAYTKAIELGESDYSIFMKLGEIAEDKGNTQMSLNWYNKALSVEKNSSEIYEKLAGILFKTGEENIAENYFKKSIEIDSKNPSARYGLAQLYITKGKVSEAERELRLFERLKEFEGRKTNLLRAVERQPRNPEPAFLLAEFYLEFKRQKEAVEILERIVSLTPEFLKAAALLQQLSETN
ncbi:MAG: tetratricopeptide repeat protein [Candidatus Latescibacterota bacterium]|nr:tetratricopeptide repeat protein [Candidatus Latescibacterota bacterium]